MQTYAQKPKAAQQTTSVKLSIPDRARFRHSHEVNPLLHLQRTIGNHAVERLLQNSAEERDTALATATSSHLGHDVSRIPVGPRIAGLTQTKLAINKRGDEYEQEADQVAEHVMRMPEPPIQRACPCGGGCPNCQLEQAGQEHEHLQNKRLEASGSARAQVAPITLDVLASPGHSLDPAIRSFMEPRFGHDFSQVRVHADAEAAQSANAVGASAFTVGRHLVFGEGQYQPNTGAGRKLLAHELSHTVQQGMALRRQAQPERSQAAIAITHPVRPTIQRKMKFEFQTRNKVTATNTKTRTSREVGRKFGGFLHKGKTGFTLETDTGGVVEIETGGWFRRWSKLQAAIQEAVDVINDIKAKKGVGFSFSEESRLRKQGLLGKDDKLEVNISKPDFTAAIQSSEGIALSQYESLLKEHERPKFVDPVIKSGQKVLDAAVKGSSKIKPGTNTDNLRSFLQVITNYIKHGQEVVSDIMDPSPVKARFRLMHRTNFSSVFRSLLSPDEQTLFRQIVAADAIPQELGIAGTDPFFKNGFWGHSGGMMAFFQGGKIVALATEDKKNIYDCSTKKAIKGTATGINVGRCRKKVAGTNITIGLWLDSITKKPKDLLSPPAGGGSAAMGGEGAVKTKGEREGLVEFETRGTEARNRVQPVNKWVDYAEEVFLEAATCRARLGTGTELNYDGSKKFDPANCP